MIKFQKSFETQEQDWLRWKEALINLIRFKINVVHEKFQLQHEKFQL